MAETTLGQRPMTFDEAARLDPDRQPGEIDRGRWVPVTKSTWRHGEIAGNVYAALREYARKNPGWSLSVGDPGTKLAHDPDVLRGPDVGMVRTERKPAGKGARGWLEGAPDLAVEVLGDEQSAAELTRRALEYLTAGARMVWVLDPEAMRLMLFTPPDHVRVLGQDDTLDGGDLLPGFACRVGELFE
ncbi:MAG: Uma2 family endonuclease [Myxococcales bacterium]|nr:Uma2 family endonuclease [Myxococcales bacterium]